MRVCSAATRAPPHANCLRWRRRTSRLDRKVSHSPSRNNCACSQEGLENYQEGVSQIAHPVLPKHAVFCASHLLTRLSLILHVSAQLETVLDQVAETQGMSVMVSVHRLSALLILSSVLLFSYFSCHSLHAIIHANCPLCVMFFAFLDRVLDMKCTCAFRTATSCLRCPAWGCLAP